MSAIVHGLVVTGIGAVLALFVLVGGVAVYTSSSSSSASGSATGSSAAVYDGS